VAEAAKHVDTTNASAELGTALHALAELCLKEDHDPVTFRGVMLSQFNKELTRYGWDEPLSEEMVGWLQVCVDYVREREQALGVKAELEVRVHIGEKCWGTVDVRLAVPFGPLEIIDFKFGWNWVEVVENTQAKLYTLGALGEEVHTGAKLTIIQPKTEPAIRSWPAAIDEYHPPELLQEWRAWADGKIAAALTPGAPLSAGSPQCDWCPAAAVCPELKNAVAEAASLDFDDPQQEYLVDEVIQPIPEDAQRIAGILAKIPLMEILAGKAREMAYDLAVQGTPVPGYKLVRKRKNRKMKDEEKAEKALANLGLKKDERFTSKLVSPSQAEKRLRKKGVEEKRVHRFLRNHVETPQGDLTLVPDSDRREAVVLLGAEADFDEVDTNTEPEGAGEDPLAFLEG
jgi:hypothetical protein